MRYLIYKRNNRIGENLLSTKSDDFSVGDIIFMMDKENIIHSRWEVATESNGKKLIKKIPELTIGYKYEENLSEKIIEIQKEVGESLNKKFIHNIKITPFYDYSSDDAELNDVISKLKIEDIPAELYIDVHTNKKNVFEKYNLIIMENFGVIIFKTINKDIFLDKEITIDFWKDINNDELNKLLKMSSYLSDDGEKLNINYIRSYIFESEKNEDYYKKLNETLIERNIKNQFVCNSNMFVEMIKKIVINNNEKQIYEKEHFAILQTLIPQYVNSKLVDVENSKLKFLPDGTYELDQNQIDVLSQMNKRCFLKSGAGSGKTILLLAKAYELACANPNKKFLFICFNKNLAQDVRILAANTGKNRANLKITNFDKYIYDYFCQDDFVHGENNILEYRRKVFLEKVYNQKFNNIYGGIFVDEMQQLNEEYILALLKMLDDNKYMILAGDPYQKISPIEETISDEDDIVEDDDNLYFIGNYEFTKILLQKNYRNSFNISKSVNKMGKRINEFMTELEISVNSEEEKFLRSKAVTNSIYKPQYYSVNSEQEEIKLIMELLGKLLKEMGYYSSEILLLSPKGNSAYKKQIVYELEKRIRQSGLEICNLHDDTLEHDGIRVGTIGRAIGLDFKAVIIYGTKMLSKTNNHFKITTKKEMKEQNIEVKKEFLKNLKNIYVACSRAREILIVIDDFQNKNNLISVFLKLVGEEDD